jgi:hypothetical protein
VTEGVVRVPENVLMERVADEIVFLDLSDHAYYGLDPIATRMMELLLGQPTIAVVVQLLAMEYDATPDILARDVHHLIDQLVESGLVERVESTPPTPPAPPATPTPPTPSTP